MINRVFGNYGSICNTEVFGIWKYWFTEVLMYGSICNMEVFGICNTEVYGIWKY